MRHSLVTRVTAFVAGTIVVSFVAGLAIVHRSTSAAFVDVQSEVRATGEGNAEVDELTRALQRVHAAEGWDGVRRLATQPSAEPPHREVPFVVVDDRSRIAAATDPAWIDGTARDIGDGALSLRAESIVEGRVAEFELVASDPMALVDESGAPWGRLVLLPSPVGSEDGDRFALRVWHSAAMWLVILVAGAIAATVWVLRRSLAPVDRLTGAARALRDGNVPARLQREGTAEFGELIDAFNAAAESIDRTDRIRRQLISDIAHELRTPVTNFRGQLEAAQQGLIAPDSEFLATLQAETRLLERLVLDFHELALSDAGQLHLRTQDLPLCEVLRNVLTPLASAAGARLLVEGPEDIQVRADEERLRQVLANLVENATRHRPRGLELSVAVAAVGSVATFELRDNGPGVAPEDRPHIFDRFYRADPSRSRATGGAGLGLAIVRGILEAMGGSIRYVADERQGAGFAIELPRGGEGRC